MANLILWRHAEAEDAAAGDKDASRTLTKRGHKDASKVATWLDAHLPANTQILSSPAQRCLQTLQALQNLNTRKVKVVDFLSIESSVERIAKEVVNSDRTQTILIVGHQPNLGSLIAKLLGMREGACVVKKGAVWWLKQRPIEGSKTSALQTYLFTVQHPDC
ncbi:MAG: phosphohistidine phosphatase [Methylotenera sp.]|nr:phosphohistidine phosphatase [Methylotenera sp.]